MRRQDDFGAGGSSGQDDLPGLAEILHRIGNTHRQAQERIREVSRILEEGQTALEGLASASRSGDLPPAAVESAAEPPAPRSPSLPEPPEAPAGLLAPLQDPARYASASGKDESDPSLLRVYSLGSLRVSRGDLTVDNWRNTKAKGILKLLLIHLGQPLPRDVFLEAFWPDQPERSANNSFRVAVHELRQTLNLLEPAGQADQAPQAPRYILAEGGNYSINIGAPLWIDVEEFEAHWRVGRSLERAGNFRQAIPHFESAERLYAGDFLQEDLYEEWALIKRERLVDVYLAILGKVAEFYFKDADYQTCIDCCQKILVKDRCREDAYQQLIVCYLRLGQRSRALRWYKLCEETLQRELECPVSPETEALLEPLTGGDISSISPQINSELTPT